MTSNKGKGSTGVRGVTVSGRKYRVGITFRKKIYYLGCYETLEEASKVRKEAETHIYGDFLKWYEKEGKVKHQKECEKRISVTKEEINRFYKSSERKTTREKYIF